MAKKPHKNLIKKAEHVELPKPYKLDAEKREQLLDLLANGHSITSACRSAHINRTSYYNALKQFPEFAEAVQKVKHVLTEIVEDSLYSSAVQGNTTAIIFWLCNRVPERWKHVNKVDTDNTINILMQKMVQHLEVAGIDELRQIARLGNNTNQLMEPGRQIEIINDGTKSDPGSNGMGKV
jgi:hypothetical protein